MKRRNLDKDRMPHVLESGWAICTTCGQWTFQERVQDIVQLRDHYVPDIYHRCLYCGDRVYWYRKGDYDSLLALYQYEARGISHITLEGNVIQALVEEMLFKLRIHECHPECECQKARELIDVLLGLRNVKRHDGNLELAKFILPSRAKGEFTAPVGRDCHAPDGKCRGQKAREPIDVLLISGLNMYT